MTGKYFWPVVGVLLLCWVGYDLYQEQTLLHKVIYKSQDPELYWTGIVVWTAVALSCFYSSSSEQ